MTSDGDGDVKVTLTDGSTVELAWHDVASISAKELHNAGSAALRDPRNRITDDRRVVLAVLGDSAKIAASLAVTAELRKLRELFEGALLTLVGSYVDKINPGFIERMAAADEDSAETGGTGDPDLSNDLLTRIREAQWRTADDEVTLVTPVDLG